MDGMKDLLSGEAEGRIFYFENKGTDEDPFFDGYQILEGAAGQIDIGKASKITMADWDGDGFMDILCGCSIGYVYFLHALGPLSLSENWFSAASGGAIDFSLDAKAANGNRNYLTLGSVTGTTPGTPLPGGQVTLPLNWDPFTNLVMQLANSPVFQNFMGKLDASGEAAATMTVPPLDPATVGMVMYYAYCLNAPFNYVSNPAAIEIAP
jgi:hypothetical protein